MQASLREQRDGGGGAGGGGHCALPRARPACRRACAISATRAANSLLQVYFHEPAFRAEVLALRLPDGGGAAEAPAVPTRRWPPSYSICLRGSR